MVMAPSSRTDEVTGLDFELPGMDQTVWAGEYEAANVALECAEKAGRDIDILIDNKAVCDDIKKAVRICRLEEECDEHRHPEQELVLQPQIGPWCHGKLAREFNVNV